MFAKKPKKLEQDWLKYSDLAKDSDNDGLSDTEEEMLGTDPNNPDSDNDGMKDYDEIKAGRNPLGPGLLRDLFIPYQGNDYQPTSLQPKRLLFYGTTAVLVKFIALLLVVFIPVTAWLTPNVMNQESQQIISLTNGIRTQQNLNSLQTNPLLQQAALNKAEDMLVNQYFAHVSPDGSRASTWVKGVGYRYRVVGENLALGFASAGDVVNAWVASPTHYANLIDDSYADIGVAMVSGNYNGFDTTLVAQYFGTPIVPVAEPEPVIQPEPQPVPVAEPEPQPEVPAIEQPVNIQPELPVIPENNQPNVVQPSPEPSDNNEVLADRQEIKPALVAPQLISPANEYLTKDNKITLDILAIQAEKVYIWADDKLATVIDKPTAEDSLSFEISLAEGAHNIQLESSRAEQRLLSAKYIVIVDNTPPAVDENKTSLLIDEPEGKTEKIIQATAYLSSDTESAYIEFSNHRIDLTFDDYGKWSGSTIITEEENKEAFDPVILATLTVTDFAGNQSVVDVGWENIKPLKTSLLNQYIYLKNNQTNDVKSVFNFGDWYYKILLTIAVLALGLSVFIRFGKQRPKSILSSFGFISLLLILLLV